MPQLNQLATRVLHKPLLLEPSYAQIFIAAIAEKLGVGELTNIKGETFSGEQLATLASSFNISDKEQSKPYQVIDGVALIPVSGTLVNKFGYLKPMSGMTGYDGIRANITLAMNDPEVNGLFLEMDTPGGEVAGCFDLCDFIAEMREVKPIWAFANEMNASAGQAIASACSHRLITQTAIAGSIGVIRGHVSQQKALENAGYKVTLIIAGKHKADGNPYQDLPADVLARFEKETGALRNMFARKVAAYSGMTIDAVKATEALCYTGQDAIDVGLADQLVRSDQALQIFINHLASSQTSTTAIGATMPDPVDNTNENSVSQADHQAAIATATANGASAERKRIGDIMNHESAEGRSALANHFAFSTDMSVEGVVSALAAAEQKAAPLAEQTGDPVSDAMELLNQPEIGADHEAAEHAEGNDLNAALNLAKGIKPCKQ